MVLAKELGVRVWDWDKKPHPFLDQEYDPRKGDPAGGDCRPTIRRFVCGKAESSDEGALVRLVYARTNRNHLPGGWMLLTCCWVGLQFCSPQKVS